MVGGDSCGQVMLVRQKDTKNIYAMKVLKKQTVLKKDELQVCAAMDGTKR